MIDFWSNPKILTILILATEIATVLRRAWKISLNIIAVQSAFNERGNRSPEKLKLEHPFRGKSGKLDHIFNFFWLSVKRFGGITILLTKKKNRSKGI